MIGRTNVGGGGGGKPEVIFAFIAVTYPEGAICRCTDEAEGKTLNAPDRSGNAIFRIPYAAIWTVTVTSDGRTDTQRLNIRTPNTVTQVEIKLFPEELQEVEYLEAAGLAKILFTEEQFEINTTPLTFKAKIRQSAANQMWAGTGWSASGSTYIIAPGYVYKYRENEWAMRCNTMTITTGAKANLNQDYEVETYISKSRQWLKVDGENIYDGNGDPYGDSYYNEIGVFGTPLDLFKSEGNRIYYAKIYLGGKLIHDLIPCYRKNDIEPGMYDMVTKQFYPNSKPSATAYFTPGPAV